MRSTVNKIGLVILIVGIAMLVAGLIFSITVGTIAVPVLLTSSILVNTVGITLLRHGRR